MCMKLLHQSMNVGAKSTSRLGGLCITSAMRRANSLATGRSLVPNSSSPMSAHRASGRTISGYLRRQCW